MSETENKNTETPGVWRKFVDSLWKDLRNDIDDREDEVENTVRVAIIGKSGSGKSSFINAIRDIDSFEDNENVAKVEHSLLPGDINVKEFLYSTKDGLSIYFYDTGGFGDACNKDYDLEKALRNYEMQKKIKFDVIVFVLDCNRFELIQLQHLKDQDKKECLILYVVSQIDVLKVKSRKQFQEEKKRIKETLLEILKKDKVNKLEVSQNNIYLISSVKSDFEDEDISPDGKRLRKEIFELLLSAKLGKPLDTVKPRLFIQLGAH